MPHLQDLITHQYEAALCMLRDAIEACPPEHWEAKIANGTVRWAAYHALFFADVYLSKSLDDFEQRPLHDVGGTELSPEPAVGLPRDQTLELLLQVRDRVRSVLASETDADLAAPDGFGRGLTRAEMHVYNVRHLQHHAASIAATVRRLCPDLPHNAMPWIGSGWRE
ncbi:MAG: DinB family protein [Planctomycetota bacterium]